MTVSRHDDDWDANSETSGDHTNSHHDGMDRDESPKETLAEEETKQIWIWKQLVIALIVATAALVSAGTYKFLNEEEDSDFQDNVSYEEVQTPSIDSSHLRMTNNRLILLSAL